MTTDGQNRRDEARRRMDEACSALAESSAAVKRECDALETLLDDPGVGVGQMQMAHSRVRAAGMRSLGTTSTYLAELNGYMILVGL